MGGLLPCSEVTSLAPVFRLAASSAEVSAPDPEIGFSKGIKGRLGIEVRFVASQKY